MCLLNSVTSRLLVARSVCAMCRSVCRSGEAEESNPGGGFSGSCRGPHTAGTCHVHCVCDGNGGLPQGQQDPAAHGEGLRMCVYLR